jgi:hypothetical protein
MITSLSAARPLRRGVLTLNTRSCDGSDAWASAWSCSHLPFAGDLPADVVVLLGNLLFAVLVWPVAIPSWKGRGSGHRVPQRGNGRTGAAGKGRALTT